MKTLLSLILLPALVGAVSLTEVVQKTLETHPQIQMKVQDLGAEQKALAKVKAGYLPSIDLSYSVGPEKTKTIANSRRSYDYNREDASATFTQSIFSGLSTVNGVKQQNALIFSADNKVKEGANDMALEVTTAYVEMLKTKSLLDIAKENVDVHEKYLGQIKEKVDAGVGRSSDYKQTLSRYENALSVFYLSEQNYKNSIYNYQRILPDEIVEGYLEKPALGTLPAEELADLVEIALKNNPTIDVSQADIQAAKAALKRSNSAYFPTVDFRAQAFWDKNVNGVGTDSGLTSSTHDENNGWNALLVVNYNLFNGMYDKASKEVYQHRVLKQSSTLADAKRFVIANTSLAWYTFKSTKQQLVHIEKNIQASAETVAAYKEENDLGRRSIIDLLNIELEYNGAKNRKVTAEYDNLLAYYQILSHTGKILEVLDVSSK